MERDVLRGLIMLGRHVTQSLVCPRTFVRVRLRVNGLQLSVRMKSLLCDRAFLSELASVKLPRSSQSPSQRSKLQASLDKTIRDHAKRTCSRVMDVLSLAEDAQRGWHIEQCRSGDCDWAKTSTGTWRRIYTHPTKHDAFASRRFEITPRDQARGCRSLMFFYNTTTRTMSWDDPLRGVPTGDMRTEWTLETTAATPLDPNASVSVAADAYVNYRAWVDGKKGTSLYKLLEM